MATNNRTNNRTRGRGRGAATQQDLATLADALDAQAKGIDAKIKEAIADQETAYVHT